MSKIIKGGDRSFFQWLYCFFFGWFDSETCGLEDKIVKIFNEKEMEFAGGKRRKKNKTLKKYSKNNYSK